MRAMIIGCGNIGFRHLQSCLDISEIKELVLVEMRGDRIELCGAEIEKTRKGLTWKSFSSLEDPSFPNLTFDLVISAVTADIQETIYPRFGKIKIENLILEKPLARSREKLRSIDAFYKKTSNIKKVFVNCSQDLWEGNQILREKLSQRPEALPCHMNVAGYNWGFGCNALHFLELFRFFFSARKIHFHSAQMSLDTRAHKRGNQFEDYLGIALFSDDSGNSLQISTQVSPVPFSREVVVSLYERDAGRQWNVDEKTDLVRENSAPDSWKLGLKYVSQTTAPFVRSLFGGASPGHARLPTLEEILISHEPLFDCLENSFQRKEFYFT